MHNSVVGPMSIPCSRHCHIHKKITNINIDFRFKTTTGGLKGGIQPLVPKIYVFSASLRPL